MLTDHTSKHFPPKQSTKGQQHGTTIQSVRERHVQKEAYLHKGKQWSIISVKKQKALSKRKIALTLIPITLFLG